MRIILLLFVSTISEGCFAQLITAPFLKQKYDSAYQLLPQNIRKNIEQENANGFERGRPIYVAIVADYTVDTLNKEELKPGAISYGAEKYYVLFCENSLKSDTLAILLYPGVARNSNEYIVHSIVGGHLNTGYYIWNKYDTSFRADLSHNKTNDLELAFHSNKFVLSDTGFVNGKEIYGYADIETPPFYKDDTHFEKRYIKKRILFRYYFKITVNRLPS